MTTTINVVSGSRGGKRVICGPKAQFEYRALKEAANQGNHWARLALAQLQGLCTGRIGKDNIYIQPNKDRRPGNHGYDEFFIILPGCLATIERKPDDSYHIIQLDVDTKFTELQKLAKKPGMYFAKKASEIWECELSNDGSIESKNQSMHFIAVSDAGFESAADAADSTFPKLADHLGSTTGSFLESNGFNLHYTPGKKSIGGLRNYKDAISPLSNQSTMESAQLLAKAMYDARNIKQVAWISEFGGSAVLTQAMQMLANQGIKLPHHTAFMIRPSTDTQAAMNAALSLDLKLGRQLSKSNPLDYIGNRNQLAAISTRSKLNKKYTLAQASWDRFSHLKSLHGLATGAIAGAAACGFAAASPISFMPAAVAPAVLTMGKILGWAGAGIVALDKGAEAFTPRTHSKIVGKFK